MPTIKVIKQKSRGERVQPAGEREIRRESGPKKQSEEGEKKREFRKREALRERKR